MNVAAIIFDFDYTLADSSRGVITCINGALKEMGLQEADEDSIRKTIGLSLPRTLETLTGDSSEEGSREFFRRFMHHADRVMVDQTVLLPHVREVIGDLRTKGMRLGIVSTKFRHRIETILEREHLRDSFEVILGGEDVARHKPDPAGLLRVIDDLKLPRETVLYVGDSVVDAETAHRAGVTFVAVLSGVTPRDAFSASQHRAVLNELTELRPFLNSVSQN